MRSEKNTEVLSKGRSQATVYSRHASKLYKKCHLQARQTLPHKEQPRTIHGAEHNVVPGHGAPSTARVEAMCASLSVYHKTREVFTIHHQSQKELSTAFYSTLSPPPIYAGIWAKGSQKGPQYRLTLKRSPNTPIYEEPFG